MAVVITWDGDKTGRTYFTMSPYKMYKVSDRVFTLAEFANVELVYSTGNTSSGAGAEYEGAVKYLSVLSGEAGNAGIPESGTYFGYNTSHSNYITSMTLSEADKTNVVTGISLQSPDSVEKGGYIIIAAEVSGNEDYYDGCTATITGIGDGSTTAINKLENGQIFALYCSADETAESIHVTVNSDSNPEITASKTITVTAESEPEVSTANIKKAFWSGFCTAVAVYGCGG